MLNVIHIIKKCTNPNLIVKPHGITSVQTQMKLGKKEEGFFFFWQLKATAWFVTKPQIMGLNTEIRRSGGRGKKKEQYI